MRGDCKNYKINLIPMTFFDQFDAIFSDETLVEQAKRQGPFRPKKATMKFKCLANFCNPLIK